MPYRIDLFNRLSQSFDAKFFFYWKYNLSQKMDESLLRSKLEFKPKFIDGNFKFFNRIIRFGIINIIRKENMDIIVTEEYSFNTFLAYFAKIIFGLKCKIYTICDDSKDIAENAGGLRKVGRNFLESRLDGIILANNDVLDYYNNNLKQKNLVVFPIIQDENSFRIELEESLFISKKFFSTYNLQNKKVFMYVGRLTAVKNLALLIKCFKNFITSNSDNILILVGDGDQKESLEEYVKLLEIGNSILFVGRYDGLELKAWYNIGQVFILPSYSEPFGAVTNEALLSGQYVLCSKAAGSSCLINDFNGSLFSPTNEEEIFDLLTIFSQKISPLNEVSLRESKMNINFENSFLKLHSFLEN